MLVMWNQYQAGEGGWKGAERLKKRQGLMGGLQGEWRIFLRKQSLTIW